MSGLSLIALAVRLMQERRKSLSFFVKDELQPRTSIRQRLQETSAGQLFLLLQHCPVSTRKKQEVKRQPAAC
jgi:hypothetical protein